MAALAGKDGKVMIGVNTVASIKNWKLNSSKLALDTTALQDQWKNNTMGLGEWGATLEADFLIHSDTNGQTALQNAYLAGTSVALKLYVDATHYYSGTGYVSKMSVDDSVEDLVGASFDIIGSGALTYN